VWDRSGNGVIDDGRELFGTETPSRDGRVFANGFEALRELDENHDSVLDENDPAFAKLRVWSDENRNGLSEPWELRTLDSVGVVAIHLDVRESRRQDRWGNRFTYRAKVQMKNGQERFAYDVFPVSIAR